MYFQSNSTQKNANEMSPTNAATVIERKDAPEDPLEAGGLQNEMDDKARLSVA